MRTRICHCLWALLVFLPPAFGQDMYIYSDLQVNESSGDVTVTASTSTDYNSAYYYDLGVSAYLYVEPQNSGEYDLACSGWNYTSNVSYVSASCSYNLGSQSADLIAESDHNLDVTYYYYQLEPYCTWECDFYDDYYGFSLISTNPSYGDNQYFFAPGQSTPIAETTSKQAAIYRTQHRGACLYPASETTCTWGWNLYWPYIGQFLQFLGGGSFNGRYIQEAFSGPASDQCWRQGNTEGPVSNPAPGPPWYVSSIKAMDATGFAAYQFTYSNAWGFDHLGFWGTLGYQRLGEYVENMRPTSGACSVTFNQSMYMYCSGYSGPGQYYSSGPLSLIINATPTAASVTSSRNGVSQVRTYP